MSDFWSGVGSGIATSAIVATVVYLVQRRDANSSSSALGTQIEEGNSVSREALRTTLEVRDIATDLHKVVAQAQQNAAKLVDRETLAPEQIAKAETFIALARGSELLDLSALHKLLLGEEIVYAGMIRDTRIYVAGATEANLQPISSSLVPEQLQIWERSAYALLHSTPTDYPGRRFEEIVRLHIELMRIHPFFDGNGLLARALLAATTKAILGRQVIIPRYDPAYFSALREALLGRTDALTGYILSRGA